MFLGLLSPLFLRNHLIIIEITRAVRGNSGIIRSMSSSGLISLSIGRQCRFIPADHCAHRTTLRNCEPTDSYTSPMVFAD